MFNRKLYRENYAQNPMDPNHPIYTGNYFRFEGTAADYRRFRGSMLVLAFISLLGFLPGGLLAEAGPSNHKWFCTLPWAFCWLPIGMSVYASVRLLGTPQEMTIDAYRGRFRNLCGSMLATAFFSLWLAVGEVYILISGQTAAAGVYTPDALTLAGAILSLIAGCAGFFIRIGKKCTEIHNQSTKNSKKREK